MQYSKELIEKVKAKRIADLEESAVIADLEAGYLAQLKASSADPKKKLEEEIVELQKQISEKEAAGSHTYESRQEIKKLKQQITEKSQLIAFYENSNKGLDARVKEYAVKKADALAKIDFIRGWEQPKEEAGA